MSVSQALSFVQQMGWSYNTSGADQAAVENCPFCSNTNHKFYLNIGAGEKDGLYKCMVCGTQGNLITLQTKVGVRLRGIQSMKDAVDEKENRLPEALPNFDALHTNLMENEKYGDVLEHLIAQRGWTSETMDRLKIGATEFNGRLWFIVPYYDADGHPVFYKMRTVPPADKDFKGPYGREAQLYNVSALKPGLDYIIIVEGESDTISMLNADEENVVGAPGANVQKASWIEQLDRAKPTIIYLLYDRDKVGQDAARAMANRIGLGTVKNILLPEFTFNKDGDVDAPGKDISEYLSTHTMVDVRQLMAQAKSFDVPGVQSVVDVVREIWEELTTNVTLEPTFLTKYPSLNRLVGGFEPGDVIGIIAQEKVGKTTFAMNLLDGHAEAGDPALLLCGEMPVKRMVRKWISYKTQTDDSPGASKITQETVDGAIVLAKSMTSDMLFGYTNSTKPADIFEMVRQSVRRYGVKVVTFDYLQLLTRSLEHAPQEIERNVKDFKAMAMELNILLYLIVQPHKVMEGTIIGFRNAAGSGSIGKVVDFNMVLHRNAVGSIKNEKDFIGYMDADTALEPQLLVKVDLARYAPGGITTLYFDGARSTVREFTPGDATNVAFVQGGNIPIEKAEV